jgi:hypothetical protein
MVVAGQGLAVGVAIVPTEARFRATQSTASSRRAGLGTSPHILDGLIDHDRNSDYPPLSTKLLTICIYVLRTMRGFYSHRIVFFGMNSYSL